MPTLCYPYGSSITCVCDPRGNVYNCFPTDYKGKQGHGVLGEAKKKVSLREDQRVEILLACTALVAVIAIFLRLYMRFSFSYLSVLLQLSNLPDGKVSCKTRISGERKIIFWQLVCDHRSAKRQLTVAFLTHALSSLFLCSSCTSKILSNQTFQIDRRNIFLSIFYHALFYKQYRRVDFNSDRADTVEVVGIHQTMKLFTRP